VPFNEPWREFSQSCLWRFLGAIGWPFTSSQRSRAFTHRCAAFFAPVQRLFVKQHHGEEAKGRVDHQATATLSSMSDTATPSSGSAIQ